MEKPVPNGPKPKSPDHLLILEFHAGAGVWFTVGGAISAVSDYDPTGVLETIRIHEALKIERLDLLWWTALIRGVTHDIGPEPRHPISAASIATRAALVWYPWHSNIPGSCGLCFGPFAEDRLVDHRRGTRRSIFCRLR